jgi:hypothetical protein
MRSTLLLRLSHSTPTPSEHVLPCDNRRI